MDDQRFFGLTPTQLNVGLFAVVGAVALAGFTYFGGVSAVQGLFGNNQPSQQAALEETPTPAATQPASTECSQLAVGCEAVVVNTGGVGLNVKSTPGLDGTIVRHLKDGDVVSIIGGPVNSDGYTWWETVTQSAPEWAAEGDTDGTRWLAGTGRLSCHPFADSGGTSIILWTNVPGCEAQCEATGGVFWLPRKTTQPGESQYIQCMPAQAVVAPTEATPPTDDYLLGQTKALAQAVIDYWIEQAKPIPNSDKGQSHFGAPIRALAEPNSMYGWEVVPGYTSEFSGAFTAEANLPVGTHCYTYNTMGGTWTSGDGQWRSDLCVENWIPYLTSIEVSQDGKVGGSWEINNELTGSGLCVVTVTAFYDVYYEGEYASTEPVSFDAVICEYDDPFYNGSEATETFSITEPGGLPLWPGLPQDHPWRN